LRDDRDDARGEPVANDDVLDPTHLGRVPMFSGCTREQLHEVAALATPVRVASGDDVVREGGADAGLYVIADGNAVVLRGGRQVATLAAGDYFGELSLFDAAPRTATVRATSPLSCILLTPDAFERAVEVPAIRNALLHGMALRIRQFDQRAYWSR
jgi:CRP-like cAMP-binding protein